MPRPARSTCSRRSTRTGSAQAAATPRTGHSRARRIATYVLFGLAILVIWEAVKFVGGVPWRFQNVLGTDIDIEHFPPFRWAFASDLNLPHWFNILAALAAAGAAQRRGFARPVPRRRRVLHLA